MKSLKAAATITIVLASIQLGSIQRVRAQQMQLPQSTPSTSPSQSQSQSVGDPILQSELARVSALRNGVHPEGGTGTRGGGNLVLVDMKSLEDLISSGKLNQLVLDAASKIDPSKAYVPSVGDDWQYMQMFGLMNDIQHTAYTYSEDGGCGGSDERGMGASTDAFLLAPVCWDLKYIIDNHENSLVTLIDLGIRAEARHFRFDFGGVHAIGEMAATQLRSN